MIERIIQAVNLRIDARRFRPVNNLSGGENTRAKQFSGALHFRGDKYLTRAARRVVNGRRAERQILYQRPVLLRD